MTTPNNQSELMPAADLISQDAGISARTINQSTTTHVRVDDQIYPVWSMASELGYDYQQYRERQRKLQRLTYSVIEGSRVTLEEFEQDHPNIILGAE